MNTQQNGPKPGYLTTEFYTMLLGNLIGLLLMAGKITPAQAQSLNSQVPLVGGIILAAVSTASYILTRFGLKLPWSRALPYTTSPDPDLTSEPTPAPSPDPVVTQPASPPIPAPNPGTPAVVPSAI